jgi:Type IV secretion-system coupling protein DNA-binding domain
MFGAVHLSAGELAGHGLAVGGPKSGKTSFLRLLVEARAGRLPIVVVDPKGSPALTDSVRGYGGRVWTLDGTLPADLLDPRPWQVPDLLLEAEDYSPEARAYRDAAHQRALCAAWALALDHEPMDLAQLRRLLDRAALIRALESHRQRDARIGDWLEHLKNQQGGIEDSGARGLDRALGILLDGPALRGSLRACPEALRLEDVLATRGLVLFSLDELTYPHATRKIAAWVLLAMGRLSRQLPDPDARPERIASLGHLIRVERRAPTDGPRALLLVDEVGALGSAARHLRGLVGRAREAGLAVVLASQGLSDLEAVDRALVHQVLQDTAWQLAFRQGSPRDAEHMQALFGRQWVEDVAWRSDGLLTTRQVERPRVPPDEWMNRLEPGDAWLPRPDNEVEEALYAAAERNGLVADDGQRQTWATSRSGLGAGLREPLGLDAERRVSNGRRLGRRARGSAR